MKHSNNQDGRLKNTVGYYDFGLSVTLSQRFVFFFCFGFAFFLSQKSKNNKSWEAVLFSCLFSDNYIVALTCRAS